MCLYVNLQTSFPMHEIFIVFLNDSDGLRLFFSFFFPPSLPPSSTYYLLPLSNTRRIKSISP